MTSTSLAPCVLLISILGCGPGAGAHASTTPDPTPASTAVIDVVPPSPSAPPLASVATAQVAESPPRQSDDRRAREVRRDPDGLVVEDVVVGKGPEIARGRKAIVHYDGTLADGKRFDSSLQRDRPFEFQFGAGHVIAGWERGLEGMRVGGTRRLEIPPDLAYGARGRPPVIPAGATLIFEIELLGVE